MNQRDWLPPLRLILTSACNGNCYFCHNEGNTDKNQYMPLQVIDECIETSKQLSLPRISLTGGEPSLRDDLDVVINRIRDNSNSKISLTTNGFRLMRFTSLIKDPIDSLNLSIVSFDNAIAKMYQNVPTNEAIDAFLRFPAMSKNLNVVVNRENLTEIESIINWGIRNKISIDLMILAGEGRDYYQSVGNLLNNLIAINGGQVHLSSTPTLKVCVGSDIVVRVKHPFLNNIFHNKYCNLCTYFEDCFEKVCAVRVYPNATVSPCLKKNPVAGSDLSEKIQNAYSLLSDMQLNDNYFSGPYPDVR